MWPQLFSVFILTVTGLCSVFEKEKNIGRKQFFVLFFVGAVAGCGIFLLSRIGFVYTGLVVLSLLCHPFGSEKTIHDIWKDIAFPLFVLVVSFIVFIAANHNTDFPSVIAESLVMLMIGGLLMSSSGSLRLTLMTVVMMVFGSYVFSVQNEASVFNRTAKGAVLVRQEQP